MRTARLILTLVLVPMILSAAALAAQEIQGLPEPTALAQQNLRPYVHVFIAYAIVIVMIGGWAISIGRRLRQVEERLGE